MAFATNADARTRLQEATGGWRARRRLLPPPPGSGRECSGHVGRSGRVTLMCRTCAGAPHSSGTPEDWNARMPRTLPTGARWRWEQSTTCPPAAGRLLQPGPRVCVRGERHGRRLVRRLVRRRRLVPARGGADVEPRAAPYADVEPTCVSEPLIRTWAQHRWGWRQVARRIRPGSSTRTGRRTRLHG